MKRTHVVTGVAGSALCAAAVAGCLVVVPSASAARSYCAIMPDTVGLYVGSHVTVRGIAVGEVTAITPGARDVRVDFDLTTAHPPRGEVSATTVSDTLVADRHLAVLFDGTATADWDPGRCITHTLTPKSVTESLDAVSKLAAALDGGGEPGASHQLRDGVAALRTATSGTGPALNRLIGDLAAALRAPDAATGHLGALIDALSALSETLRINWDEVKAAIGRLAPAFEFINDTIFGTAIPIIERVGRLLVWVNSLLRPYGGHLLDGAAAAAPVLRLLAGHSGELQQIVTAVPPIAAALGTAAAAAPGDGALVYGAPAVALPQAEAERLCAAMNALTPHSCPAGTNLSAVRLSELIFSAIGGR
ncbi:MlaD family protein [Nocardia sp. NPDC047648]|uniref:MlaD family protein n=1 Tax=Nocardia sp. NPDC047648 TaxID=3155625 RepID=UPI0033EFABE7